MVQPSPLTAWQAEDKLRSAEEALCNTRARISQLKRDSRNAVTLEEQERIQKELIESERRLRRQRQEIFDVEDEIIEQRDALIDTLQQRMQEETETQTLFVVRWRVV